MHASGYRKLGKTTPQRKALLRNQVTNLLYHGKIVTTEAKAKEIRKVAEGLIALAVKEKDNFETVTVTAKVARKDAHLHGQDPVLLLRRPEAAGRSRWLHRHRTQHQGVRRRRLPGGPDGRHHDHARSAQGSRRRENRCGRERQNHRSLLIVNIEKRRAEVFELHPIC